MRKLCLLVVNISWLWLAVGLALPASAGEADVIKVNVVSSGPGVYRFDVTLRHGDEGWTHYADRWDVVAPDGTVLAERVLHHPHVNEQPFTRALPNVRIPEGLDRVIVRGHDSVHGLGGAELEVTIPR